MNRPLVWVAVSLLIGTLAAAWGRLPGLCAPLCVAAACVLAAIRFRDPRVRPFVVALSFAGVGAMVWDLHATPPYDPLSRYIADHTDLPIAVRGTVRDVALVFPGDDWQRFTLEVDGREEGDGWSPVEGGVAVRWAHPSERIYPGDRVVVDGKPRVAIAEVNPGVRGYEYHLRNRGVHSAVDASGGAAVKRVAPAPWYSLRYWAAHVRQRQADNLAHAMPEDVLPFVYAVWLGHQSAISQHEYQEFVWSGTAHLLSVSGIHAAIVAFTLNYALRVLQLGRRRRALLVMGAVCAFALVAGARVPAARAAIMVCLYLSADLLEREPDTPTALSLAGILFILWDPHSVFDIGFQLSFASVSSILLFAPLIDRKLERLPRYLRGALSVSLSVQILPLPIAAANFHAMSLAAPLANLVAIPLLSASLWLCFVASLLSFVWMPLAQIAGHAVWVPIKIIQSVAHAGTSLHALSIALTTPTAPAWTLYWIAAAFLGGSVIVRPRRRKTIVILAATAWVLSMVLWRPNDREPEIVMLDVGHGDASFIRTPTGETLLIDGGDLNDYGDRGQQIVAPFLWARGITRLDAIMVSHSDSDHIGGLLYIVDNFRVGTAIMGGVISDRPLVRAFLDRCAERGVPVVRVAQGQSIAVGNVELAVYHPPDSLSATAKPNNLSVVARVPFGAKTVLYTGDIETDAESTLNPALLHADILKVPHHGADTSSSLGFIEAVAPTYATISTGSHGRRVLDQPIVDRYQADGITVLRTDRLGAIRFTFRNGELHPESERMNRGYPIAKD